MPRSRRASIQPGGTAVRARAKARPAGLATRNALAFARRSPRRPPEADRLIRQVITTLADASPAARPRPVIQAKKLDAGKLNVAGEDHPESGPRRLFERLYVVQAVSGGQYWTETDFMTTSAVMAEGKTTTIAHKADPLYLGGVHEAEVIGKVGGMIRRSMRYVSATAPSDPRIEAAIAGALDPNDFRSKIVSLQTRMKRLEDAREFEVYEELRKNKDQVAAIIESCKRLLTALDAVRPIPSGPQLGKITAQLGTIATEGESIGVAYQKISSLTGEQAALERSRLMHQAAQRSDAVGLWKVGDAHVTDLAKEPGRKYTLLTRGEFNADFPLQKTTEACNLRDDDAKKTELASLRKGEDVYVIDKARAGNTFTTGFLFGSKAHYWVRTRKSPKPGWVRKDAIGS